MIYAILVLGLSLPLISWVLLLLLAGYLAWIVRTSADGGRHLPDFPEFRDVWSGIVLPLLLLGFSLAVALAPLLLVGWNPKGPASWICALWAVFVFPILAMVSAVTRSVFPALNVVNLVRIAKAIFPTYVLIVLFLALLVTAAALLRSFFQDGVPGFFRIAFDLYVLFVVAHLLGRGIHETEGDVVWDG